jgi:hypothetical protein
MGNQKQKPDIPPQHQEHQPGSEAAMTPRPESAGREYKAAGKLQGKVALISGGDSGIGRAVAVTFAKEGANVVVAYLDEHQDAKETQRLVQATGRECVLIAGDVADSAFCSKMVETAVSSFGKLDILVNNAAQQFPQESIEKITDEQLEKTFRTNIFSMFYAVRAAMPHLKEGARIGAARIFWIIRRPKARSWRSRAHCRNSSPSAASMSTRWRRGRCGRP